MSVTLYQDYKICSTVGRGEIEGTVEFTEIAALLGMIVRNLTILSFVMCLIVLCYAHQVVPFMEALSFVVTPIMIPMATEIVTTMTLALGPKELIKYDAIVIRLAAIKGMAGIAVLCSDKTGTSTELEIGIDHSPGHVDFSSEVTVALRITDGAMVVVDCIEGCAVPTEIGALQALQEHIKPCLFMNKVNRCILEMMMDPEDVYTRFRETMEDVNVIIATYNEWLMGDVQVDPAKGIVAFGPGLHGWGFNAERFAKIYAAKMGVDQEKMMKRLWGDSFYSANKKTLSNVQDQEGETVPRAFCQFIMTTINQLMTRIMNDRKGKYEKMMGTLGIVLKGDEKHLTGKTLIKRTMQIWINAADILLSMIVMRLPSPRVAQKYRVESLYEGPMDDETANTIRACDAAGPLMMYVSKMVPTSDKGRFSL